MSPWSQGVSKIIGETQLSLRECDFAHLFEKEGFINALPALPGVPEGRSQGMLAIEAIEPPLLERGACERSGGENLFAALEAKMTDVEMLPWQAFAMLETELVQCAEEDGR